MILALILATTRWAQGQRYGIFRLVPTAQCSLQNACTDLFLCNGDQHGLQRKAGMREKTRPGLGQQLIATQTKQQAQWGIGLDDLACGAQDDQWRRDAVQGKPPWPLLLRCRIHRVVVHARFSRWHHAIVRSGTTSLEQELPYSVASVWTRRLTLLLHQAHSRQ